MPPITVDHYTRWYKNRYGVEPDGGLIERFREINDIKEDKVTGKLDGAIAYFEDAVKTQTMPDEQKEHFMTALDVMQRRIACLQGGDESE